MKRLFSIVLAAITAAILASCAPKENIVEGSVVGQWRLQKQYVATYVDDVLCVEQTSYSNSDNTMFYEFKATGDYSMIATNEGVARIPEVGTYTKIANKLVLVDSMGRTLSFTIESLTRTVLVFIGEYINEDDEKIVTRSFFEKIG